VGASQFSVTWCDPLPLALAPVPLRPINAVPLVDELLWMDSCPVEAPAVVGSNCTSNVTAKLGFKVTGKVAPDIVKPVPLKVAELIVTGAVPAEVNVTGSVDEVFTVTLPNVKLAALMVNVGTVVPAAFSCRANVLDTPPALAVRVTDCAAVTDDAVAVKPALVALAATATVAGTVTAALLLAKPTLRPLLPAAELSVTVQVSFPAPVTDALLQERALNAADAAVPVPAVPVLVVAAVLLPEALPQPETETTARQHVNTVNSFAHKPSSLGIGPRLHGRYELNNVLTSVNAAALPRLINERSEAVVPVNFGPAAPSIPGTSGSIERYRFFTLEPTKNFAGHCNPLMQIAIEAAW
jgi:hypothetical protein